MSLALSTLLYEWRRYLAAVIALALAGVLMLALSAMFIGMMQSFTATIDKSRAQLIILSFEGTAPWAAVRAAAVAGSLPKRVVPLIYRHPDVVEVQDLARRFRPVLWPRQAGAKSRQHHGHRHDAQRPHAAR
jgi:putative ABC transport system permease protein